jgi:hypothetical protein
MASAKKSMQTTRGNPKVRHPIRFRAMSLLDQPTLQITFQPIFIATMIYQQIDAAFVLT